MARRALPDPARVRGDARRQRTRGASGASGCSRCSTTRPPSTSATSGTRRPGSFARDYLAGPRPRRGDLPRVPARARARRHDARRARRARRASRAEELRAAGLDAASAAATTSSGGSLFPLADARGRVLGFQARRLHEDDPLQAKYVNTPESELFTKGAVVYGLDKARAAIATRGPRLRRRGEHRRDRAAPGRASSRSSPAWARRSPSSSCASSAG